MPLKAVAALTAAKCRQRPSSVNCSSRSFQSTAAVQGAFSRSTERRQLADSVEKLKTVFFLGMSKAARRRDRRIESDCERRSFWPNVLFHQEASFSTASAGCCLASHGQYDEIGRSGATRSRGQLGRDFAITLWKTWCSNAEVLTRRVTYVRKVDSCGWCE